MPCRCFWTLTRGKTACYNILTNCPVFWKDSPDFLAQNYLLSHFFFCFVRLFKVYLYAIFCPLTCHFRPLACHFHVICRNVPHFDQMSILSRLDMLVSMLQIVYWAKYSSVVAQAVFEVVWLKNWRQALLSPNLERRNLPWTTKTQFHKQRRWSQSVARV